MRFFVLLSSLVAAALSRSIGGFSPPFLPIPGEGGSSPPFVPIFEEGGDSPPFVRGDSPPFLPIPGLGGLSPPLVPINLPKLELSVVNKFGETVPHFTCTRQDVMRCINDLGQDVDEHGRVFNGNHFSGEH